MSGLAPSPAPGLLQTVVGVLAQPVPTLRRVSLERRVGWAMVVVLVVSAASALALMVIFASALTIEAFTQQFPDALRELDIEVQRELEEATARARAITLVIIPLVVPGFSVVALVVTTAIYQVTCRLLGGKGPYSGLLAGFGFADVPFIFGMPFSLLPLALGLWGELLSLLVQLGLLCWVAVLWGIVIRENNSFSTARATAALLIPQVVLGLLVILAALLFFMLVLLNLSQTG